MPFSPVTGISIDSKNKVWLSFCHNQNGGIGNFTKADMSDFYHFNKDSYPGFFSEFNRCVMSISVGKNDTAYFATFTSSISSLYSALDTQIINNYDCLVSGEFQKIRYIYGLIHASTTSGLLRVGDTICEVLRPSGINPALPVPLSDYAYCENNNLIITSRNETNGFYYETDTGWTKLVIGITGLYNALWTSQDYKPTISNKGHLYVGIIDSGLFLVKGSTISRYTKEQTGTGSNRIVQIKEDKNGVLWVATRAGLSRLKNGEWQNFNAKMPWLESAYIFDIQFDHRGNTWISSNSGLTVYNPKGVYWDTYKPNIPQLKVYPNPFDREIMLETDPDYTGIIRWELYDLYGRQADSGTVYKKEAGYLPENIHIPGINSGIYILRCWFDNGHTLSTKLLKLSP